MDIKTFAKEHFEGYKALICQLTAIPDPHIMRKGERRLSVSICISWDMARRLLMMRRM